MSWTQAVCEDCWDTWSPGRDPVRMVKPMTEVCCVCGEKTKSGIYVRADPKTVPHPRKERS
jgi:hypothetical protein